MQADAIATHILDALPQALIATDLAGTVIAWNRAAEELYGWRADEAIGQDVRRLITRVSGREDTSLAMATAASGQVWRGDMLVRGRRRRVFLAHVEESPLFDASGQISGLVGVSTDVTTIRALERAAEESEQLQRTAANAAPALIAVAAIDGGMVRWVYANEQWQTFTGRDVGDLIRLDREQLFHADDLDAEDAATLIENIRTGEAFEHEMRVRDAAGRYHWFLFRNRPVLDSDGHAAMSVIVGADINERREAQRIADERAQVLRRLADAIPALIIVSVIGEDGSLQPAFFNRPWETFTGLTAEQLLGPERMQIYAPDDLPNIHQLSDMAAAGSDMDGEFRFRRADGELRWHHVVHRPVRDNAGRAIACITVAIETHERHLGDEARARLAAIVNGSLDAIISTTLNGTITSWNHGAEELYGYTADEAIGQMVTIIVPPGHDEEVRDILDRTRACQSVPVFETVRRTKDGRLVQVAITLSPIVDDSGTVTGASSITRDITREKRLLEDLQRASHIKDEFLALVSHELRTPVTTMMGLARVLGRRAASYDDETRSIHEHIMRDGERLHATIENMLLLTRLDHDAVELEPLLLQRVVPSTLSEHRHRYPHRDLRVEFPAGLPPVHGHPGWIAQVVENLVSNAEKYSPPDQPITIAAHVDGREIAILVSDRGPGITPEEAKHVFEAFYRTPGASSKPGIGLGLAVCRRLMELQYGSITVRPVEGGGTCFEVRLPAAVVDE